MIRFAPLVRMLSETVSEGWLTGQFHDFVLLTDPDLVAVWQEVAPNQPVAALNQIENVEKCIVFDAGEAATELRDQLKQDRPSGTVLSFFTEYYPSVCAQTFAAGQMADDPGDGLIMFQTPRTGSHLMQSMITNLGDFGPPDEWIRPPVVEAERLGVVGVVDHLIRCARHQRVFHRYWSTSIVLPFLADVWERMPAAERQRLVEFVRHGHVFLMTRQDRVAQTWSQIRATHSGRFFALAAEQANKSIEDALLPPEKFWLWIAINRENVRKSEALGHEIARLAGKRLAEVTYEELQTKSISKDTHKKALGSMYKPSAHKLDAGQTKYFRQSTAEDEKVIANLTRLVDDIEEVDFSRWRNIERTAIRVYDGTLLMNGGRFDIWGGRTLCEIPLRSDTKQWTAVLGLEIAATEQSPVKLSIGAGETAIYATSVTQNGSYLLFADGARLMQDRMQYMLGLEKTAGVAPTDGARVRLLRIYTVPVGFDVVPGFPWMTCVEQMDGFALYRLG